MYKAQITIKSLNHASTASNLDVSHTTFTETQEPQFNHL